MMTELIACTFVNPARVRNMRTYTKADIRKGDVQYFGWGKWTVVDVLPYAGVVISVESSGNDPENDFTTYTTTVDYDDWMNRP